MLPGHEDASKAVAIALRALERRLVQLVDAIVHEAPRIALSGEASAPQRLRRVCDAYATIDLAQEDAPNQSAVCVGVVGGSRELIALAGAVNSDKAALKACCVPLQGRRVRVPLRRGDGQDPARAIPLTRAILRSMQRSDLNLLAAYRRIPVLPCAPERVVYTEARTRAVYRMSRVEVLAMLANSGRPGAEQDIARVRTVRDRWFGLAREHYANVRANLWLSRGDAEDRARIQVAAELPLLFHLRTSRRWPTIVFPARPRTAPAEAPPRARAGRLQAPPFLQTLPVYRYRGRDPKPAA